MNSNEDELQKAINDITNSVLNETPVAPEGVAPAVETPVSPVEPAMPEATDMTPPIVAPLPDAPNLQPTPVATETPVATPEISATPTMKPATEMPATAEVSEEVSVSAPKAAVNIPDLSMPEPINKAESAPEPISEPTQASEQPKEEAKPVEEVTMDFNEKMEVEPGGVKEKALRDLMPILGKMSNVEAEKKFKIYCDMIESLDEKDVANDAYEAATQIGDDNVRGEALLKLVDLLDK